MAGINETLILKFRCDIQSLFIVSTYFHHLLFFLTLLIRFNDYENKWVYFKTGCSLIMVKFFKMYDNKFTPYGAFPYIWVGKTFTIIIL